MFAINNKEKYDDKQSVRARTTIPPVMPNPIHDQVWATNSFGSYPQINSETNIELIDSGYLSRSDKCDPTKCPCDDDNVEHKCECNDNENVKENYEYPYKTEGHCTSGCSNKSDCSCSSDCKLNEYLVKPTQNDDMISEMGYFQSNYRKYNIPSNLAVGECQKNKNFKDYNKNIFTNIIQPGIYARSEVTEPTSANIGISQSTQFQNVVAERDCDNSALYLSRDPRQEMVPHGTKAQMEAEAAAQAALLTPPGIIESENGTLLETDVGLVENYYEKEQKPDESNIYDPRFYGWYWISLVY